MAELGQKPIRLCPRCREAECAVSRTGRQQGYCAWCKSEYNVPYQRARYQQFRKTFNADLDKCLDPATPIAERFALREKMREDVDRFGRYAFECETILNKLQEILDGRSEA